MAAICPYCAKKATYLYKCSECGDLRCSNANCTGGPGTPKGMGGPGMRCKVCKKGKYKKT